jgi:FtsP/CotA-like multicopper oxidase with cupredoxin domain
VKGDAINITVVNNLLDSTVAVHWHGISQHGTPFMDGASMVTQFPIVPMQSFRYEVRVEKKKNQIFFVRFLAE